MIRTNYEVPHCGAFSTRHSHPSWVQIFTSGSCFQIPLAWISPLMLETILYNYTSLLTILLFYIFLIFKFLESRRQKYLNWRFTKLVFFLPRTRVKDDNPNCPKIIWCAKILGKFWSELFSCQLGSFKEPENLTFVDSQFIISPKWFVFRIFTY